MEKRLTIWKVKYLSFGGHITLSKSALPNLLVYFLSLFKCPSSVAKWMKRLLKDFLWSGREDQKKLHLANWAMVC